MAQGRYPGALQFYGMGRSKPTHRQGRNRQSHRKILKNTSRKARKIALHQSPPIVNIVDTPSFGGINRTGRDPSAMLRSSFSLTGAVVLGMIEFESSGFVRTDL